jgi:hypothetical protein
MTKLLMAALVAALHITPTVVLVKREDAVRRLFPTATAFTAQDVRLSKADASRLRQAADWSPEKGEVTFYAGTKDGGSLGTFTFVRVDTQHGPIEVAVAFTDDGAISQVIVTKVTVETKPWMLEALRAGLIQQYAGLRPGTSPHGEAAVKAHVGALPAYIAGEVDKGVARALAAYHLFYRPSA